MIHRTISFVTGGAALVRVRRLLTLLAPRGVGRRGPRRCTTAELRPGWVELRGRVRALSTVVAPLSGREVVGHWSVVEHERGFRMWEPLIAQRELRPFVLEDAHGRALVEAPIETVRATLPPARGSGGPFNPPPARIEHLLRRRHHATRGVLFDKAFRWRERRLEDGDAIVIRGRACLTPPGVGTVAPLGSFAGDAYRRPGDRPAIVGDDALRLDIDVDEDAVERQSWLWTRWLLPRHSANPGT